jgi:hypothetical protein
MVRFAPRPRLSSSQPTCQLSCRLLLNDAFVGNITITPTLSGYGVIATSKIAVGEKLADVPARLALSSLSIDPDSSLGKLIETITGSEPVLEDWPSFSSLMFLLIHEAHHNGNSFWAPYFALLPHEFNGVCSAA